MGEIIDVTIPHESVNDETVRILNWKVPSGTLVDAGQAVCTIETSKAVTDISAPATGAVRYTAAPDDEVAVGAVIFQIVSRAAMGNDAPSHLSAPSEAKSQSGDVSPARLTHLARKMADELAIDPSSFPPGSLVRKDDVLRKAGKLPEEKVKVGNGERPHHASGPGQHAVSIGNSPSAGVPLEWGELPRRKMLEGRLLSQGRSATMQSSVTLFCRAPRLRERAAALGLGSPGINALIAFEVGRLLESYPELNAVYDRGRLGKYLEINVGWAVDGGQGLVVPVVRGANRKTLQEVANVMEHHIEAYVEGTFSPADFAGGTFTVTDLSGESVGFFQPLIIQGQSGILGIGSESGERGGEIFSLTLAFDHQVTEGAKGRAIRSGAFPAAGGAFFRRVGAGGPGGRSRGTAFLRRLPAR